MRALVLAATLGGCGFEHGAAPASGGGDVDAAIDASVIATSDAAMPDAPPPCPDDDSDGICNDVDDWPCGAKPSDPPSVVTITANGGKTNLAVSLVSLGGNGRFTVEPASTYISLALGYSISDTACSGNCVDQIEVGFIPGNRSGCVFDATVSKQNGATGFVTAQIRTPTTPGSYDFRINLGQNYGCTYNGASNWWQSAPDATRTAARLCVH